ncbi:P-loop ATPase, Sll1717 family [Actinokineospora globicatena]|nr:hypothetical protein [Actinokineospora globicatena]
MVCRVEAGLLDEVDLLVAHVRAGRGDAVGALASTTAFVGALILSALGDDPAVLRLVEEVREQGRASERTRWRAQLAVDDRAEHDADFAATLHRSMSEAGASPMTASVQGTHSAALDRQRAERVLGLSAVNSAGMGLVEQVDIVTPLYFGRDDAEHDIADGLLRQGFLHTTAFAEALSGRKSLIIGRKGSGKSAICMRLAIGDLTDGHTRLITPDNAAGDELRRFELAGLTSAAAKSLLWRYVFATHAARFLIVHARRHRGRRSPSIKALRRFLQDNGETAEDQLLDRVVRASRGLKASLSFEALGAKVAVDTGDTTAGVRVSRQLEVLEAAVRRASDDLGCVGSHGPLMLLVDQLEQTWSDDAVSIDLVTGLLMASKHCSLVFGSAVRCVVFLRSDVYDSLTFSDADKFHSDELRIDWTGEQLGDLALARASASLGRRLTRAELWGEVFPVQVAGQPTEEYLVARMLPRPRDAIQFLNLCRDTAHARGHRRVEEADVLDATLGFSKWKRLDLAKEYGISFPFLDRLLILFHNMGYVVTRAAFAVRFELVKNLLPKEYPAHTALFDPDIAIELLYRVGFLGVRRGGGVEYASRSTAPIQPHESEFHIHLCFRPALNAHEQEVAPVHNVMTGRHTGTAIQVGHLHGGLHTRE